MADATDQIIMPNTSSSDAAVPSTTTNINMANPQDMVDAALGSPNEPTLDKAPTQPVPPSITPLPTLSTLKMETPPVAPVAPSVTSPMPELSPMTPPSITTVKLPDPLSGGVKIGDDTPLAFATPVPSMSTTTTTTSTIQQPASLPPLNTVPSEPPKKKSKMFVGVIGGILFLVVALGGGLWSWNQYISPISINKVTPDENMVKVTPPKVTPPKVTPPKNTPDKGVDNTPPKVTPPKATTPGSAVGTFGYNYSTGQASTPADWNNKNAVIAGTYIAPNGERFIINIPSTQQAAVKYNIATDGGLQGKIGIANSLTTTDKVVWPTMTLDQFNAEVAAGRTWVPPGVGCNDMPSRTDTSNTNTGAGAGGSLTVGCTVWHWTTCTNKGTGVQGVGCDVTKAVKDSSTETFTPPTVVDEAPTLVCSGLTRTPDTAAPLIGDKITLTCAGAVVPSTAGTLSYKFRYSINGGAYVALPNKTDATAEITIAACGTYSVECHACATLSGVLTCNPVWVGATQ